MLEYPKHTKKLCCYTLNKTHPSHLTLEIKYRELRDTMYAGDTRYRTKQEEHKEIKHSAKSTLRHLFATIQFLTKQKYRPQFWTN